MVMRAFTKEFLAACCQDPGPDYDILLMPEVNDTVS